MTQQATWTRLRKAYESYMANSENETESVKEVESFVDHLHDLYVATGEDLDEDFFPELSNLSAAFMYRFLPVPEERKLPEFVYVPSSRQPGLIGNERTDVLLAVSQWNVCWEAAQNRFDMFGNELPDRLKWLRNYSSENIYLLPASNRNQYNSHAVLYHLLPRDVLSRHGLPCIKKGNWPHMLESPWCDALMPHDFDDRLSRAFADVVWGSIDSGSPISSFSKNDSLQLLAHNLDFWLPYAYRVSERRLQELPRVEIEDEEQQKILEEGNAQCPIGVSIQRPRMGGSLWMGQSEASQALSDIVNEADNGGKLRGLIEAIRTNRVEEDFSDRWSFAKEDFERKLYRKRAKIKVKFVELTDTIPVHGPESEVHENLLWEDFMGILNTKERQVTVLLRNGYTRLGDVAGELGYANHSPVSKALNRIRSKAQRFFD